jgi:methionyl-tRNA synthetase
MYVASQITVGVITLLEPLLPKTANKAKSIFNISNITWDSDFYEIMTRVDWSRHFKPLFLRYQNKSI